MLRMTTTLVCIISLVGFAFVGNATAECNDAGWDEECLDRADQALAVCTTVAEGEYFKCVYVSHIEESICHRFLRTALRACQTEWANNEAACRC